MNGDKWTTLTLLGSYETGRLLLEESTTPAGFSEYLLSFHDYLPPLRPCFGDRGLPEYQVLLTAVQLEDLLSMADKLVTIAENKALVLRAAASERK